LKVELLSHMPSQELRELAEKNSLENRALLQHLSFTFAIEGISRACSHQLVRHRLASFSQKSQRYVKVRRLGEHVVIPKTIEEKASKTFGEFIEALGGFYGRMIESGVPTEDARFILSNATETSLLVTMDGRALYHFFGLRCCNRAQWEIRAVADEMLSAVRDMEPDLFNGAGPYCFQLGYCPEGRFTCGRMKEVIERYRSSE
jgi:thymidylate synthase (FAD)